MKRYLALLLLFFSCAKQEKPNEIKVAATPVPQAQILEFVKPDLKAKGYDLKIVVMDDFNLPNRALAEKEVDANYFQHIPFMKEQIKNFGYPIECSARIHLEPMAIYSKNLTSLDNLPQKGTIALPSDPTNEYRALALLEKNGVIKLKSGIGLSATVNDITSNPKQLTFRPIDAALLPRTLGEVDAAAIPTNYALQAGLNPKKQALAIESKDSPYANIIAIRKDAAQEEKIQALKEVMLRDKVREFILEEYQGAIIPILKECPQEN